MAFFAKKRALTAAVVLTTIVIVVFAALQYRWTREISEATGVRLADTLLMSIVNWHIDLERNFAEIGRALDGDSLDGGLETHARRFADWKRLTRYPQLVADAYVLDAAAPAAARRFDERTGTFEPAAWPDAVVRGPEALPREGTGWRFEPAAPALLRPIASSAASRERRWLVIALDPAVITQRIFPELAHRYFQGTDGLDYEIAVTGGQPRHVLYASDAGFGSSDVSDADGTLNVFGRPLAATSDSPMIVFHKTPRLKSDTGSPVAWFPLLRDSAADRDWTLVVRHRRGGPLGAFLADTQRRDLVMSLGALLLLVASIALLVVTSLRAQRLAALQMDFVTTVSHELRTPLTIISSAADNIEQGVVQERAQVTQYGSVIRNQVRQLSALVEQILLFARHNRTPQRFTLQPLAASEIIDATLASTDGLIRAAHFTIERDVEPGLPPVMGDKVALAQCLQNLVTNALKYGRDRQWLGIRARLVESGPGEREIQIAVSDRGIGIAKADLPHIFEPFYRSPAVTAAQIHGTGLGLSLAKDTAEAIGGRLTVTSDPGRGTTFTLHLPCSRGAAAQLAPDLHASGVGQHG
ncbi:MAG TPA: HAMP domain-containing sensor histidine kinase [Vicinamibacterales bacterium]|jgi:signal transduction histidine kinase